MTKLVVTNALTGRRETLRPAQPPVIHFLWRRGGPRSEVLVSALLDALVHLGFSVNQAVEGLEETVELYCGREAPPPAAKAAAWIRWGADADPPAAMEAGLFRYLCLRAPYREALDLSPAALGEARSQWEFLRASAARLKSSRAGAQAHPGAAGYMKRFRDALADDFDFPAALEALADALRPGALSPASQAGVFADAESALGLDLFRYVADQ